MTSNEYSGMMDCFRKTIARDGVAGLYRGMSAPVIAVTPIFATYFWGFDLGKDIAAKAEGVDRTKVSTWGIVFAGGFSAIPGTMVMVPGDLIKVKLQVESDLARKNGVPPRFKGPLGCARDIFAKEGPRGFFRGTALTLLRWVGRLASRSPPSRAQRRARLDGVLHDV
jgi:solute carrier family 25 carnitine/acylcarnitine transporter 20/29